MSKEMLVVVEAVSNEKGVAPEIIFEAIEAALASATRKRHDDDIDVRVAIDRESGEHAAFRRWEVVADENLIDDAAQLPDADEAQLTGQHETSEVDGANSAGIENLIRLYAPQHMKRLSEARVDNPTITAGEFIEEPIESADFGRIAAQAAKQVIVQKVREAERGQAHGSRQCDSRSWRQRGRDYSARRANSKGAGPTRRSHARLFARCAPGAARPAVVCKPYRAATDDGIVST
jgi:N utilization substance protein A